MNEIPDPVPSVGALPSNARRPSERPPVHVLDRGLFITGTDTDVGKTVVTAGLVELMRAAGRSVVAVKPFATGCEAIDGGRRSTDVVRLMEAMGREPDVTGCAAINPVRLIPPMAPAAAAEASGESIDWSGVNRMFARVRKEHDTVLVEGVGGALVPLDPEDDGYTVADFAAELRLGVLVVCRPILGTLNHTAMTVEVLQSRGCRVVGLVTCDARPVDASDVSRVSNAAWLTRMTGVPVLAEVRHGDADSVRHDLAGLHTLVP